MYSVYSSYSTSEQNSGKHLICTSVDLELQAEEMSIHAIRSFGLYQNYVLSPSK